MNRATENRGVDLVEQQARGFQALPGGHRFRPSGVGNVNINPSGEPVFKIPRALTVANNDESSVTCKQLNGLGQALAVRVRRGVDPHRTGRQS